jgi:glutathione synthase/RimK-type ligase-like ATP-grasp enzyme
MKQLTHIGTIELVSLPNDLIQDVPAKIDTGADSSAIWASNIKIRNGKLSFNFFGPGSAYYRQDPVVTSAFKTATVKNSFGHGESRYKIRLKVKVGDYTLTRWFSLADRSRNTYPILLGKNFLHGRFVVDVSQKYLISQGATKQSVLVMGAKKSEDFFNSVSKINTVPVSYECEGYESLLFDIDGLSTKVINTNTGTDIADYGLTYFKSHNQNMEFALAAAVYLHFKGKPVIDHELRSFVSMSKLTEYMKMATFGLPVPPTICGETSQLKGMYTEIKERLGSPFVLKEIASNQGKENYLIKSAKDYKNILAKATPAHIFAAQKYIENDGFMRIYVAGREAGLAIWRSAHQHKDPLKSHLNKPSGGSNASLVNIEELPAKVRELAEKAAGCMERQVAGVDLLQDNKTGAWYILEANNAPQLRNGSFSEEKIRIMAKFFDKELKR